MLAFETVRLARYWKEQTVTLYLILILVPKLLSFCVHGLIKILIQNPDSTFIINFFITLSSSSHSQQKLNGPYTYTNPQVQYHTVFLVLIPKPITTQNPQIRQEWIQLEENGTRTQDFLFPQLQDIMHQPHPRCSWFFSSNKPMKSQLRYKQKSNHIIYRVNKMGSFQQIKQDVQTLTIDN